MDPTTLLTLSVVVFVIAYFFIATELIDKTIASLFGGAVVMILHLAPFEELLGKIDLSVIGLLVGMMVVMDVFARTGVFEWLALTIAKRSKGSGMLITAEFLLVTAVLSALLDNVTTVILIAPITILIAQILEIPAVPILILEAVFSNIGGTATLIGDPPNIVIGIQTGLTFNQFIYHMAPVCIVIALITLGVVYLLLRKTLVASPITIARLMKAKPGRAIVDPVMLKRALPVFILIMAAFFTSRFFKLDPGLIAMTGATLMVFVCRIRLHQVLERVEWDTIMFFIGLFVMIGALEINGLFKLLGNAIVHYTNGSLVLTTMVILWVSAIVSAIVNNIPLVIAMIPLIKTMVPVFAQSMGISGNHEAIMAQIEYPLYWGLALGVCLGGNGTIIGASANVVVTQVARRNKYKLSFWDFTKYGFPLMLLSLIISSFYVYWRYLMK